MIIYNKRSLKTVPTAIPLRTIKRLRLNKSNKTLTPANINFLQSLKLQLK